VVKVAGDYRGLRMILPIGSEEWGRGIHSTEDLGEHHELPSRVSG